MKVLSRKVLKVILRVSTLHRINRIKNLKKLPRKSCHPTQKSSQQHNLTIKIVKWKEAQHNKVVFPLFPRRSSLSKHHPQEFNWLCYATMNFISPNGNESQYKERFNDNLICLGRWVSQQRSD